MRAIHRLTPAIAVVLLATGALRAQEGSYSLDSLTPAPSGFYLGFGVAYGSESDNCSGSNCDGGSWTATQGGSAYFGLGGTVGQHWRLGFELDGWTKSEASQRQSLAFFNLMATFYPTRSSGFWIKAGAGIAERWYVNGALTSGIGSGSSAGFGGAVMI